MTPLQLFLKRQKELIETVPRIPCINFPILYIDWNREGEAELINKFTQFGLEASHQIPVLIQTIERLCSALESNMKEAYGVAIAELDCQTIYETGRDALQADPESSFSEKEK